MTGHNILSEKPTETGDTSTKQGIEVFSFGEAAPVLSRREFLDYAEARHNGRFYEPPLSLNGLSQLYRAATHHGSAIQVKRNVLRACFIPSEKLSTAEFSALALDYLVFANCYLEREKSRTGKTLRYTRSPAKFVRVGLEYDQYWWCHDLGKESEFEAGSICHIKEHDINQEIYGVPDYIASMNSTLLNESATLFRRRYYENGSHAGFIMYLSDANVSQTDVDKLREALKNSKGPGNFRNLFLHSPGGDKDGIKLIPVAEVAAKDDFISIKNVSRDDQLAAHRVPPQLMGIVPSNTGGFGDATKAAEVFDANEMAPIRQAMLAINDWAGEEIIRFRDYALAVESKKA